MKYLLPCTPTTYFLHKKQQSNKHLFSFIVQGILFTNVNNHCFVLSGENKTRSIKAELHTQTCCGSCLFLCKPELRTLLNPLPSLLWAELQVNSGRLDAPTGKAKAHQLNHLPADSCGRAAGRTPPAVPAEIWTLAPSLEGHIWSLSFCTLHKHNLESSYAFSQSDCLILFDLKKYSVLSISYQLHITRGYFTVQISAEYFRYMSQALGKKILPYFSRFWRFLERLCDIGEINCMSPPW